MRVPRSRRLTRRRPRSPLRSLRSSHLLSRPLMSPHRATRPRRRRRPTRPTRRRPRTTGSLRRMWRSKVVCCEHTAAILPRPTRLATARPSFLPFSRLPLLASFFRRLLRRPRLGMQRRISFLSSVVTPPCTSSTATRNKSSSTTTTPAPGRPRADVRRDRRCTELAVEACVKLHLRVAEILVGDAELRRARGPAVAVADARPLLGFPLRLQVLDPPLDLRVRPPEGSQGPDLCVAREPLARVRAE